MITLALSKGRIFEETLPLLAAAGIEVTEDPEKSRKLILATTRPDVRVVLVRASDVPTYVQYGGADLGVTGLDVLLEHGNQGLYQPLDLQIAACRLSVAVRADYDYATAVRQGARLKVATKYVGLAREFFASKGVHVDLIKLYGSMELAPLTGLADAIVDLVSTGNTLKANHLVEVERIMDISARLVVNQAALKLKREPIRHIIDAFANGASQQLIAMTLDRRSRASVDRLRQLSKPTSRRGCIGRPRPTRPSSSAWPTSWPTCSGAATRRCWSTPSASTASTPPAWRRWSSRQAELRAAFDGLPAGAARARSKQPRAGCAATTRRRRRPAAKAGATATRTAPCWARRSRRWTASASTCRAARRPIPSSAC